MRRHPIFRDPVKRAIRLPQAMLMGLVRAYRLLLSPWLGSACRFTPTCSAYALDALAQHGAAAGSYLTLARLARCQPWCDGGHDPVPAQLHAPKLLSRLLEKPPSACTSATDSAIYPTPVSKTLL
jgi:uncharacterized protein